MQKFVQWLEDANNRDSELRKMDLELDSLEDQGHLTPDEAIEIRWLMRANPAFCLQTVYPYLQRVISNRTPMPPNIRQTQPRVTYGGGRPPSGSGRVIRHYPKSAGAGSPV